MARIVRALLPGMLATVAMAAVAPTAHAAGTATITNGTLYFLGTSGSDKVTITNTANPSFSVRIKPVSNDPDGAATGCTLDGTQTLTCGDAAGFRHVEVYTGTGDDSVVTSTLGGSGLVQSMRALLGDGNDESWTNGDVEGDAGNDTLMAFGGTTDGGDGNDAITIYGPVVSVTGGAGNDTLTAFWSGAFTSAVAGGDGDDAFVGGDQADHFYPEPGNDDYTGGAGADVFHGTPAGVASTLTSVSITADDAAGDGRAGEADNVHSDIEVLEGTDGDDRLDARRVASSATLRGFGGDDTLIGSANGDTIQGGPGANNISAGAGDDIISTEGPGGQVQGADGNDSVTFSGANTLALGGTGDDVLTATGNAFFTASDSGGDGNDTLNGNPALADTFLAEPGNDTYHGGTRAAAPQPVDAWLADTPEAPSPAGVTVSLDDKPGDGVPGESDDVASDIESVRGTELGDVITASSASGAVAIDGRGGADDLTGSVFADALTGGPGNDNLIGGLGADELASGDGDDLISARDGISDHLVCGLGADTIAIDAIDRLDPTCIRAAGAPGTPGGPGTGAPGGTGAPVPGARVTATLPRLYVSAGSLVFNRFAVSVTRRGAKCPRAVTMRTAFRRTVKGRTLTVRVTRALRPSKKACIITTKVALPSSARRLPALSVSVRGVGVKSRTVRARRIGR